VVAARPLLRYLPATPHLAEAYAADATTMNADLIRMEPWRNYATIYSGTPRSPRRGAAKVSEPLLRELEELAGPGGYEHYAALTDATVRNVGVKGKFTLVVNLLGPTARYPDNGRSIAAAVTQGWEAAITADRYEAIGISLSEDETTLREAYIKILAREVEDVLANWKMSRMEARYSARFNVAAAKDVTPVEWAELSRAELDLLSKRIQSAKVCRAQADLLGANPGDTITVGQVNELLRRQANRDLDNDDIAEITTLVQQLAGVGYQLVLKGMERQPLTLTSKMRADRGQRRFVLRYAGDKTKVLTSPKQLPPGLKLIRER